MMKIIMLNFFKRSICSRAVYLLVVINLCLVASAMNRFPSSGHGSASCFVPMAEGVGEICHLRPPPMLEIVAVLLNLPALFAGASLTEVVERIFPHLCSLMTAFNLLASAGCVTVQWTLVGRVVDWVLSRYRKAV